MDMEKFQYFMQASGGGWITWKRNPPYASHMGGAWERQIRSVRSILSSLIQIHSRSLDEQSLAALMAETERILNSWPLTTNNISDLISSLPLSPSHSFNHLKISWRWQDYLWFQSKIVLPSPEDSSKPDSYSCRIWRRVQHIVDEFWCRWKNEFLQSLQEKKKWTNTKGNLKAGDIVILQEANTISNDCDEKGFVWSVRLRIGSIDQAGRNNIVDRPVSKVALLLESEKIDKNVLESSPREPWIKCNVISRYHVSWRGAMY